MIAESVAVVGSAPVDDEAAAVGADVVGVALEGLARGKARLVPGPVEVSFGEAEESGGAPRKDARVFAVLDAVDDTVGRCGGVPSVPADWDCASEVVCVVGLGVFGAAVANVNALFALGAPKPAKPENLGAEADN